MRIAHVGSFAPESADGVCRVRHALAVELARLGVDVDVWNPTSDAAEVREHREAGVTIFDVPVHPAALRNLWRVPRATAAFLRERPADLVHLHSVFLPENIAFARHLARYIVSPHGGYSRGVMTARNRLVKAAWMHVLERPYLHRALALHAVSPSEADDLRRLHARVEMVPNGCDAALLERATCAQVDRWVFLGRLSVRQKGLDLLVTAYAQACREASPPPLVVAGPDFRGGLAALLRLSLDLGVADRVQFPGAVYGEEKLRLLDSAVVLQTSRWEGLPLSVIEAMALGRPVVVTPQTNAAEWVAAHRVGWVVPATVDGIARGLRHVLDASPDELERMGASARVLARREFSWPQVARRMADVYSRLAIAALNAPTTKK